MSPLLFLVLALLTYAFFNHDHKDRVFSRLFEEPKKAVNSFIQAHGRLPTEQEFPNPTDVWMCSLVSREYNPEQYSGSHSSNDYVLSIWRGDWNEYYYSWSDKDTATEFNASILYISFLALWSIWAFCSYKAFTWKTQKRGEQSGAAYVAQGAPSADP